jgi:drug/metabolite transporter (DMT)-like permease
LPLVALFSPEEGIGPRRVAGVGLGFVGLALLLGEGALDDGSLAGRMACVAAAMCYAVGSVLTRRAPPMPPVALATGTLCTAAIVLIPLAFIMEGIPEAVAPGPAFALLYVALFPTAIAAVIRVRVIKTAGSLFMSLTSYMVPVWAVVFGIVLLGESLPPQLFYALALILLGIALSQSRAILGALRS